MDHRFQDLMAPVVHARAGVVLEFAGADGAWVLHHAAAETLRSGGGVVFLAAGRSPAHHRAVLRKQVRRHV